MLKTWFSRSASNQDSSDDSAPQRQPRLRRRTLWVALWVVMHVLGALTSVQAVMSTRTAQGAVAWAVSLNTFPYVAVPAYWVLGQSKFDGSATWLTSVDTMSVTNISARIRY